MSSLELLIANKNVSSWSLRAYLALSVAGIPFRETRIPEHLDESRKWLDAKSPSGKVPVLIDGDLVIHESLAILEYLAELFPEKKLWPEDRKARAWARAIASEMHGGFGELRRNLTMNLARREIRGELDPGTQREVDQIGAIVRETRARFGEGGPFLFGAFTHADAMFAPVACRFRTYGLPLDPVTKAWCEAIYELPALRRWEADALREAETEPMILGVGQRVDVRPADYEHPRPSWAVIFASKLRQGDPDYAGVAARMVELAKSSPGCLGMESARGPDGLGITVCYWSSPEAIAAFRADLEHAEAQRKGRERFYEGFHLVVARVDRESRFGSLA